MLSCTIGSLVLEIPVDLSYRLDQPYTEGGTADLTFAPTITFDEQTAAALIDAGTSKIDIISLEIATQVLGATPSMLQTSLSEAPINDFDLDVDTDNDGIAGPRRIDLDTLTRTTSVTEGAEEVELRLGLADLRLVLGPFEMPNDCVDPTLVGSSARFPVQAAR